MKNTLPTAAIRGILCDMDGVVDHGNRILPGTLDFIA